MRDDGKAAGHLNEVFFVLCVKVFNAIDRLVDLGVHLFEDHVVVYLSGRLPSLTIVKERALGIHE